VESTDLRGPQRYCRVRGAARARPSASAAIGLILAGTLLGCTSTPVPGAARQQSPSTASSPARDSTRTVSASRSPAIGKAYPFQLLIHCGVPIVDFGGRAWQPVAPVPAYPGPRLVNGTAIYTGYVAGTMTLVNARRLLFVADSSAVASPFSVVYEPLAGRVTRSPCSLRGPTGSPGAPGMNDRRRQSAQNHEHYDLQLPYPPGSIFQPVAQTARLHKGRIGGWDHDLCRRISCFRSVTSRC
jgi:hypothetical protein